MSAPETHPFVIRDGYSVCGELMTEDGQKLARGSWFHRYCGRGPDDAVHDTVERLRKERDEARAENASLNATLGLAHLHRSEVVDREAYRAGVHDAFDILQERRDERVMVLIRKRAEGPVPDDGEPRGYSADLAREMERLRAERDRLVEALTAAAEALCRSECPSKWKSAEPQPHTAECVAVRAALSPAPAPEGEVR